MASQVHRWLLFVFSLVFLVAGCLSIADKFHVDPFINVVAGVFYIWVAVLAMSAHFRTVVGETENLEEESYSSY